MDDRVAGGVVRTERLVTCSRGDAFIAGMAQCTSELLRRIVRFERLAFLALANRVNPEHFGIGGRFKPAEPFIACGNDWWRASAAVARLRAAPAVVQAGRRA